MYYFSLENKQIGIVLRVYYYAELHIPKKRTNIVKNNKIVHYLV